MVVVAAGGEVVGRRGGRRWRYGIREKLEGSLTDEKGADDKFTKYTRFFQVTASHLLSGSEAVGQPCRDRKLKDGRVHVSCYSVASPTIPTLARQMYPGHAP